MVKATLDVYKFSTIPYSYPNHLSEKLACHDWRNSIKLIIVAIWLDLQTTKSAHPALIITGYCTQQIC